MRREELYLADMVEAAKAIGVFMADVTMEKFMGSEVIKSAVLMKLIIIGEAASKVPAGIKEKYPDIPWRKISDFRNYVVHAYFSVDWILVWNAAAVEAPALKDKVDRILKTEFSKQRFPQRAAAILTSGCRPPGIAPQTG